MGFRFRKSYKWGPFRFTASKSGISTSVGVKGARITRTARGTTRATASIPGTGLSWVEETGKKKKPAGSAGGERRMSKKTKWIIGIVAAMMLFGGVSSRGEKTTVTVTPAPSEPVRAAVVAVTDAPTPTATPEPTPEPSPTPEPTPTLEPTPTPRVENTYILNVNTGTVHRPGCRFVKQMKDSNKQEIVCTREELQAYGYNLCDTCNP